MRTDPCTAAMYAATPSQVAEALDWLTDCFEAEELEELAPRDIVLGVERHYEGGWAQFVSDAA